MYTREFKGESLLTFPEKYIVIELETTGFDPNKDKILEIGALKVNQSEVIDSFNSFVQTDNIPDYISSLTGITSKNTKSAPTLHDVMYKFYDFIGNNVLVGHNVNFDINFLYDNLYKITGKYLSNNFVDTLRITRRQYKGLSSYKLSRLSHEFNLKCDSFHRALSDCYVTKQLYELLASHADLLTGRQKEILSSIEPIKELRGKRICLKCTPQYDNFSFIKQIADKNSVEISEIFYKTSDFLVLNAYQYSKYKKKNYSEDFDLMLSKANFLEKEGTLTVLSETMLYDLLHIPLPLSAKKHISDITSTVSEFDETHPFYQKTCVFTGGLEKMTRKEAMQIVVNIGGFISNSVTKKTNFLILGNNAYCPTIKDGKSTKQKKAEKLKLDGQDIEIISENVFYDLINL